MKIAYVIPHADRSRGGAESYLLNLVDHMIGKSNQVTILCQDAGTLPEQCDLETFSVSGSKSNQILGFWNQIDSHLQQNS